MDSGNRWDEKERLGYLAAFPELNPNPVVGIDDGGVAYANPAARAFFPDLLERGEGHPLVSSSRQIASEASELRESDSGTGEVEVGESYYHLRVYLVPDTVGIHVYATDITEQKEVQRLLAESEWLFRQLFDHSADAIFLHDTLGRIVDCNVEACVSLGYTREELLSLSVEDFVVDVLPEDERRQRGDTPWKQAVRSGPEVQISFHENEHRRKDGSTFPVEVGISAVDYDVERLVLASARDISGRRLLEEELAYRTRHDPVTGLPNQEMLDTLLERTIPGARRRGESFAVMFLHLGGLGSAREQLGYRAGDRLLNVAAQRIRGCLGLEDAVCRVGDDLAVLAESARSDEQAAQTALDILEDLQSPLENGEFRVETAGATVGVALAPDHTSETDSPDPLSGAYEAMCQARRQGDSYKVYS